MQSRTLLAIFAVATAALYFNAPSSSADDLASGFRNVPSESRMRMYWRVFGPAWTEREVDRQLALMKEAGLGGVTIYFLYPVAVDNPGAGIINQRFGSPEFLRTFGYAARRAEELGLSLSVNGGTGWPFGGPAVAPRDMALKLREVRAAKDAVAGDVVRLGVNETIIAAFLGGRDVTNAVRSGRLPTPLPDELCVYIAGPTGQEVKRAAFGGEGHVLSHYDRAALERWLSAVAQPLLAAAPGRIKGFGCDSLEVYRSNWTRDLPFEFRKRRGYDLIPHLPELFNDASTARSGLRFDFWRTLAELVEVQFIQPLGDWCDRRGLTLEMEPYGTPPSPMTAARSIALPTGEHYEWKGYAVQRYVASMARIAGRNVVGAEAWTWAGIPNRLGDSLSDIKLVSDMTFLSGANDLTGVDFPYSPVEAGAPGWLPYFGPVLGPGNPQWRFFPALVSYLNRCQWMLRQGDPGRRVAVYLPVEDAFSDGPVDQMLLDFAVRDRLATGHPTSEFGLRNALRHQSDLVDGLIGAGYDFDGLDFWAISRLGRVRQKSLIVGKGTYEAIILPNLERIEPEALARINAFCREGGTVVATRRLPDKSPGLKGDRDHARVNRFIADIFGDAQVPGVSHACGRGRGIFVGEDKKAGPALEETVIPNVRMSPHPETVGFVQRRTGERDIFFFVNVGQDRVKFMAQFPGPARRIEAWDAMTGDIRLEAQSDDRVEILLPPRGSIFIVAGGQTSGVLSAAHSAGGELGETLDIAAGWAIAFEGPDAPAPTALTGLVSWTDLPGGRYFSGLGVYRTQFNWEGRPPSKAVLAFSEIREAAEIRLNRRSLGVLFNPPLEADATTALRSGVNVLEIIVANLPLNRFLGLPDQDPGPLRARFGSRFPSPEEKKTPGSPAPSGLIGKVHLLVYR